MKTSRKKITTFKEGVSATKKVGLKKNQSVSKSNKTQESKKVKVLELQETKFVSPTHKQFPFYMVLIIIPVAFVLMILLIVFLRDNFLKTDLNSIPDSQRDSKMIVREISIRNNGELVLPRALSIKKGDTVKWSSFDNVDYTVTFESRSYFVSANDGFLYQFENTGEYDFFINNSSIPLGKIIVREK